MKRAGKTAIESAMEARAARAPAPLPASAPVTAEAAPALPPVPAVPPVPPVMPAPPTRPIPSAVAAPTSRRDEPGDSPPAAAAPAVLAPIDEQMLTQDGLRLHLRRWPAGAEARGFVQIVHGLGEHIGRYEHVAAALNAAGWDVAGHDQRGHGRSEGPRGSIPHPLALLGDLAMVTDHLRTSGRRILLGHSMGGLVAARFVAENLHVQTARFARDFDALVLSSPALDIGLSRGQRMLLGLLGRLAPGLRLGNGLRPQWVSRDPAVVKAYMADPLVHDRISPRLVRFMVDNGAHVLSLAPRWRVPTLLLWAGEDLCVNPRGSEAFAAAAPAGLVHKRCYRKLYHEIFNEPEQADVLADLTQWLRRF